LFGIYVDGHQFFLAIGEVQNAATSVEFAKVKTFQGKLLLLVLYISYYTIINVILSYIIFAI